MNLVNHITHNVSFMHWSKNETNQINLSEIYNIVCLLKKKFNDKM